MADCMTFPDNFEDFIKDYEFKDTREEYTNGSMLIPSFRVIQAWEYYKNKEMEHYKNNISQSLNNIYSCLNLINNNLYDIEDEIDYE